MTDKPVKVYNFGVEDFHTYHVSGFGVLVHNANDYANPRTQNTSDLNIQKIKETKRMFPFTSRSLSPTSSLPASTNPLHCT